MFADHIFNGYGNAKKDFLKQVRELIVKLVKLHFAVREGSEWIHVK